VGIKNRKINEEICNDKKSFVNLSAYIESKNVDPSLSEISVTFNEEMMDQSWSWAYEDKNKFPQITGQAYYSRNNTTNILPVKLEPNKEYVIWINTSNLKNFKDKSGNPALPFKFTFKTK